MKAKTVLYTLYMGILFYSCSNSTSNHSTDYGIIDKYNGSWVNVNPNDSVSPAITFKVHKADTLFYKGKSGSQMYVNIAFYQKADISITLMGTGQRMKYSQENDQIEYTNEYTVLRKLRRLKAGEEFRISGRQKQK